MKDLEAAVSDQKEKIRRQFQLEELQQENKFADLLDKLADLQDQSVIPNADLETQRELRQVAAEFRGLKFEGLQEIQGLADELATIQGVIEIFPEAIAKIRESGSEEALAVLPVFEQILSEAQTALPKVQKRFTETTEIHTRAADRRLPSFVFWARERASLLMVGQLRLIYWLDWITVFRPLMWLRSALLIELNQR